MTMKAAALYLLFLLSSSTNAFLTAAAPSNGSFVSLRLNKQPTRCVRSTASSGNDGLHLNSRSSTDIVGIRGGGGEDASPTIVEKTRSFVSKNFFLIGMGVAVSFAKLLPEVSNQAFASGCKTIEFNVLCCSLRLYSLILHYTESLNTFNTAWKERWHPQARAVHWKVWRYSHLSPLRA